MYLCGAPSLPDGLISANNNLKYILTIAQFSRISHCPCYLSAVTADPSPCASSNELTLHGVSRDAASAQQTTVRVTLYAFHVVGENAQCKWFVSDKKGKHFLKHT